MRGSKPVEAPFTTVNRYPMPVGFNSRGRAAVYRWFSGRPMNGHRYTNATGFRYGSRSLDVSGHATSFQLLPGYLRFLYARLPVMAIGPYLLATLIWPMAIYYLTLALALVVTWRVDVWRRTAAFRRDVIEPVSAGAGAVLHMAHVAGQGHRWVRVPANFRDDPEAKIVLDLPPAWVGQDGDKAALVKIVAAKLAMDELTPAWSLHGGQPSVSFSKPPAPPVDISWQDAMDDADNVAERAVMVGYGPRHKIEIFSLLLDSPHMLIAGGAGAGKSVLLAWMVGQFMRRGHGVLVLDAKFVSHLWLNRIPGVAYCSESEDIHNALIWLDEEIMRRARFIQHAADPEAAAASLTPLVAVLEEMTAARNRLDAYWKSVKGPGDPAMSPALRALGNIANMGRELLVYVLSAGQSMTAKSTGGPEGRESFGVRALARATANQWKMLASQIKPAPIKRNRPGRWHMVIGDTLHEFQVPFIDLKNSTAMAAYTLWATSGASVPDVAAMMAGWATTTAEDSAPSSEAVPEGISLRQFADEQGLDLPRLRRWSEKKGFPVEVAIGANRTKLYDRDHLRSWVRDYLREPAEAGEEVA